MMGERAGVQAALFYEFDLERHVPGDHLLRSIDRFVDLSGIRAQLQPFYSAIGRPSIDPELMIRMLIIGYVMGIRSERRLCEEVHLNLAESRTRSEGTGVRLYLSDLPRNLSENRFPLFGLRWVAGFAGSALRATCRIIRRFPRTAMAGSATAICFVTSSNMFWRAASRKGWSAARALAPMPRSSGPMPVRITRPHSRTGRCRRR